MKFLSYISAIAQKCIRFAIVIAVLGTFYLILLSNYRILDATVLNITDSPDGKPEQIALPFSFESAYSFQKVPPHRAKSYKYTIDTIGYFPQSIQWRIMVDDCITGLRVNGL